MTIAEANCSQCKQHNKIDNEATIFVFNKSKNNIHAFCEFHYICFVEIGTPAQKSKWEQITKEKYFKLVAFQ